MSKTSPLQLLSFYINAMKVIITVQGQA